MMADYHFGASSFKYLLWIKQKTVFDKLEGVDVEFETPGAFDWIIADPDGAVVRTVRENNERGGWASINLPSLGLFRSYSIGFRKANDVTTMKVKRGAVQYGD